MLKETVLGLFLICFVESSSTPEMNVTTPRVRYHYPKLFRDHVYKKLSEKGKEMFYAVDIHPLCKAKKGHCISRAQCIGQEMLYISRICYKRDLVCCYDNTIRFPEVADGYHTTTTNTESIVVSTAMPSSTPKQP